MRVLIKVLLVVSLWWSAMAPAVAAAMGCCEPDTPCCMVQGAVRGCTVCPPAALHVGTSHGSQGDAVRLGPPRTVETCRLNERLDDIWRPPMGQI
jgi:hypothetical protein